MARLEVRTAVIGALAALAGSHEACGMPPAADLVLLHGRILTVDAADRVVQALAVRDGQILDLGDDPKIVRLIGPNTRIVDLQGRAATPGLIDTHAHVLSNGEVELFEIQLSDARSLEAIVDRVAARVAKARPGEWIVGSGWDEGKLPAQRYPTAADLDRVSPNNPVWLEHTTGHYGVANSAALKLAGVAVSTPAPPAGTIERLPDGRPAGVLKEAAQTLVERLIPDYSPAQRRRALLHMLSRLHAEGMTGFKDPSLTDEDWEAYWELAKEGRLSADVCGLLYVAPTLEAAQQGADRVRRAQAAVAQLPRGSTLRVCGVKLFMDGSGAAPTAWMYEDWNRRSTEVAVGNRGYPATDPGVYRRQVKLLVGQGISIGTHAIGDRAIDWVVDSYSEALKETPRSGLRLSIIHANTPTDHAISVMAELEKRYDSGIPESQPGFAWWIGDIYAANLGPVRAARLNPFATYLRRGMIWGAGSDNPVTPIEARYGLWASTARQTLQGLYGPTPFGLAEAVDIHAALRSYTAWAARQIQADERTGVLAPGMAADIAVWDRDPYEVPTVQVKSLICDMTLFQGKIVYERPRAGAAALQAGKSPQPPDAD